jgi:hypothetical protein
MGIPGHTYIILSNMHTFTTNSEGDINPVVDKQRDPVVLGNPMQSTSIFHQGSGVASLVSVLDTGDATF